MIKWYKIKSAKRNGHDIYGGGLWLLFFGDNHAEPCYWSRSQELWVYAYDGDSPVHYHKPTHYAEWNPPK